GTDGRQHGRADQRQHQRRLSLTHAVRCNVYLRVYLKVEGGVSGHIIRRLVLVSRDQFHRCWKVECCLWKPESEVRRPGHETSAINLIYLANECGTNRPCRWPTTRPSREKTRDRTRLSRNRWPATTRPSSD
ncbi:unnamed protein product, partial [Ectocarpus sp. 12 AP-2014]